MQQIIFYISERIFYAAKLSALSSGKIDKYKYLIDEEILPHDQSRIIEQANLTYLHLVKGFEKSKNNWELGKKTSWGLKSFESSWWKLSNQRFNFIRLMK